MSLYIKGLDMPKQENIAFINVSCYDEYGTFLCMADEIEPNRVVEIPTPHGNLIDVDKYMYEGQVVVDYEKNDIVLEAEE